MIDIIYIAGLFNQIRLNAMPQTSSNSEQIISRFFHRPHTPPSSALLMEKRLIFCIIKDEGEKTNEYVRKDEQTDPGPLSLYVSGWLHPIGDSTRDFS